METVTYEGVRVVRRTEAALLIDFGENEEWIPLSQVDGDSEIDSASAEDDEGEITITAWIAVEKGLE